MLDRLVNIFFLFSLIFIFILFADLDDHIRMGLALILSLICSFIAFILNWLTLDGMKAAILFGLISFGLGAVVGAVIVLVFFISSSLLSKDIIHSESILEKKFRRNGHQVWSNGFWFAFWIMIWFLTDINAFLISGVASMASATADTWASEIGGNRLKGKTWLFPSFKTVQAGTDGGISVIGTIASLLGAVSIGGVYWFLTSESSITIFIVISSAGVFGSLADSFFGARVQGSTYKFLKSKDQKIYIDNNMVNWMASGSASFIALLAVLIL